MTMLASQITSLTVVYSIVHSCVNQRKHQSSASLAFVREIHRGPVNFPHKWPVTRKMFPFDDIIMIRRLFQALVSMNALSRHNKALEHLLNIVWSMVCHEIKFYEYINMEVIQISAHKLHENNQLNEKTKLLPQGALLFRPLTTVFPQFACIYIARCKFGFLDGEIYDLGHALVEQHLI